MEYTIGKAEVEAFLMLLYKLDEHEACEKLLEVYQRHFVIPEDESDPNGFLH